MVGGGENATKGPFETAQQQFLQGEVMLLCTVWFCEINGDFERTIKILARKAAAREDSMSVCPLVNTDRMGGAFPIVLQQFRRAIGVAVI